MHTERRYCIWADVFIDGIKGKGFRCVHYEGKQEVLKYGYFLSPPQQQVEMSSKTSLAGRSTHGKEQLYPLNRKLDGGF